MEIITSVVLVTIVIILVTFCLNNKFMVSGNSLPGPIAWPFFGNILMVSRSKNFYQLTKSLQEKYGNVYRLKLGQLTVVCISGHKNLSRILVEDGENSSQRPNWMFCSKKVFKEKGESKFNAKENLTKMIRSTFNSYVLYQYKFDIIYFAISFKMAKLFSISTR